MSGGDKKKHPKIIITAGSAVLIAVVSMMVLGAVAYWSQPKNKYFRLVEKVIPYPAVIIDGRKWVTIGDLEDNTDSLRRFYENQDFSQLGLRIDFNTEEGEKRLKIKEKQVLAKMIEDGVIEVLAAKEGIMISASDLSDNVDARVDSYGNRDAVMENLNRLYGWDIEAFKEKVVRPSLYQEALEARFLEKYQQKDQARQKIEAAEKKLNDGRGKFADIVKEFSDGSSSETGGELGWFKKDMLIPEIAEQIFSMKKGETSQIMESSLGFHIIELEDRRKEGEEELVRIRQIFSAKPNFADWLMERMREMKITILVRDYKWNRDELKVEFRDAAMNDFEKESFEDPKGDGSVIF